MTGQATDKVVKPQVASLNISALEWFDKVCGNSYFSAIVTITFDDDDGHRFETYTVPFGYGSGNMYLQEAAQTLIDNGDPLNGTEGYMLRRYCEDEGRNITFTHSINSANKATVKAYGKVSE